MDELVHYGVKGMKWGVRKDGKPQGHQYGKAGTKWRKRRADKKARKVRKVSSDYAEAKKLQKKDPASLSNDELQGLNRRLQLETQYKQLTATQAKQTKEAKFGKKALSALGAGVLSYATVKMSQNIVNQGSKVVSSIFKTGASMYAIGKHIKNLQEGNF